MTQFNANTAPDPQEDLKSLRKTAQREASVLGDRLKAEAYNFLRQKQDETASSFRQAAQALRDSQTGADGTDANRAISAFAGPVADTIESSAERLQSLEPEEALRKMQQVARANPAAVALGAVAVGFIAARFLSASAPASTPNTRTAAPGAVMTKEDF